MMPLTYLPTDAAPVDDDLAEQALPGHGIPSQDPSPGAQFSLQPEEAQREAKSVLVGGGLVAGAVAGAAIGVMVAGPVGVVVGSTVGALAGALGGEAAGALASPQDQNGSGTAPDDAAIDAIDADADDADEAAAERQRVEENRANGQLVLPLVDPGR